jgi:hypothetical protein
MLWQYALPADSLRSLYEEDPWRADAVVDFVPRLASMAQHLITGMPVHRQAEAAARTGKKTLNLQLAIACWIPHQARRAGKGQPCDMTAHAASGRMGSVRASWLRELMPSLAKTFPRW